MKCGHNSEVDGANAAGNRHVHGKAFSCDCGPGRATQMDGYQEHGEGCTVLTS